MDRQQLRSLTSAAVICLFQNPLKVTVGVTKDDSDQLKAGAEERCQTARTEKGKESSSSSTSA